MNEIINIPQDATLYADFIAFIDENEIAATVIETLTGKKHICREPGLSIVGKRVISFEKSYTHEGFTPSAARPRPRPGSGVFVGWVKVDSGYVVQGAGAEYNDKHLNAARCNYYVTKV